MRARESATFVPKKLAFEQSRRQRRAMHHHEFRLIAPAQIMNRVRGQLLAGAALAFEQNIRGRRRDLPDRVQHFP